MNHRDRVLLTPQEYCSQVARGISPNTIRAWLGLLSAEAKASSGIIESPTGAQRWIPSDLPPAKLVEAVRDSKAQAAR